jgi:TatD DNase family protein
LFFNFHTHKTCENALVSSRENPGCSFWSLEKHPWYLPEKFIFPDETFYEELSAASALGEIGLDRLRGPDLKVQREYLKAFLAAAERCGKPVVIHAVRCDSELDFELSRFSGRVLIHGFCGGNKRLQEHLQYNRFVSFAPGGWKNCPESLRASKLRNIGLETDDTNLNIEDIYLQAETETGISGWENCCADNFIRFIRGK